MKVTEAYQAISVTIDEATTYPLSDSALTWLAEWCEASTGAELRSVVFDEEPEVVEKLCVVLGDAGATFVDSAVAARLVVRPKSPHEIHARELWLLDRVLSASGTRLCTVGALPEPPLPE